MTARNRHKRRATPQPQRAHTTNFAAAAVLPVGTRVSVVSLTILASLVSVSASGPAAAIPVPLAPGNEAVAEQWVNPAIRPADGEEGITIDLVRGPSTLANGADLSLRIAVHNYSDHSVDNLEVTPRRGPISASVADARVATIAEPNDYAAIGGQISVPGTLNPGESVELDIAVSTDPATPGALPMPGSAVYPIMLVLSGDGGSYYDSERFHVGTVAATSEQNGAQSEQDGTQEDPVERRNVPGLTMIYPIAAPVDIVPGETGEAPENPPLMLESENVADQLAPDGRLTQLLETYQDAVTAEAGDEVREATCLAIDPALVSTVERMADGYVVTDTRPPLARKPQRLRDSWNDDTEEVPSTPGRGADDAADWLEQLRTTADSSCVVALPWANSDINAVAQGGEPWLMREAIERGPFTLERILGVPTIHNVVLPPSGYVAEEVPPTLGWADHAASTVGTDGMHGAWEKDQAAQAATDPQNSSVQVGATDNAAQSNLERDLPPNPGMATAPVPTTPVRVLLSDNSVSRETSDDPATQRFANLSPGVTAVTFQDSLASTLASAGSLPLTTGYSNTDLRFDVTKDSIAARDITAANAVRLAVEQSTTLGQQPAGTPVMVNPPGSWDARTAREALQVVEAMLADDRATAMTLEDYLTIPAGATITQADATGSPYADPTVFSDAEVLSAGQQARYVDDLTSFLVPDPAIALTRYGYTLPLRRDLLTALSIANRRSPEHYSDATANTQVRLNNTRDTLNELRGAVNLIPPGNVFTRTSESAPLFIVAENGLPLPVDATLLYEAREGTVLNVPDQLRIPARGSITIEMTATIPESHERTDMRLYLASPQGRPISAPIDISVRTAATEVGLLTVGGLFVLFLALVVLLLRSRGTKKQKRSSSSEGSSRATVRAEDRPPD